MKRLALILSALVVTASAGCADSGPLYTAKVFFEPNQPISAKNITMRVEIGRVAGGSLTGATVTIAGSGGAATVASTTLTESETKGTYVSRQVVFPADGTYSLQLKMDGADGSETHTVPITATCGSNGEEGAPCCKADACSAGLSCVYGVCRADLMGDGGPCHAAGECQSGVCTDELCAVPACDDKIKNGTETDLDCGGSCDVKCGSLMGCKVDGDCLNGACVGGACGLGPGELLGVEGKTEAPKLTTILDNSLFSPTDLDFSTDADNELWIVNKPTDSFTVVFNVGKDNQTVATIKDLSQHFMEEVTSIDFSDNGTFGTCGESNNSYGGKAKPNNFMGPVLWPAQYSDYTGVASAHSVHADMLHSTPFCMGIAAVTENKYFVFNGMHNSIDWYDFGKPHKPGGSYHADGVKKRFAGVKVKRQNGVPSHLHYDKTGNWLYIADTGNSRVIRMNDSNSVKGKFLQSFGGDGVMNQYSEPQVQTLNAPTEGLSQPSGVALHAGTLYISDAATGMLHAFDVKGEGSATTFGKHIKSFDTGLKGKLSGIDVGPDQRLYVLDRGGKLLRLDP